MAIARQGSIVEGETAGSQTTATTSVTVSAGSNMVLVVRVHVEPTSSTISSVVWNGAALTLLDVIAATTWTRTAIYILKNPTPATGNLVTTVSSATHFKHSAEILTGVDQTTTNRTTQKVAADTGTSTTLTVPSVVSGDYVVDATTIDGTGHSYVAGANQTPADYAVAYQSAGDAAASHQAGSDGGVMSGSWTTTAPNSQIATAFIPAGGGTDYTATVPGAAAATAVGPTPTASSRPYVNTNVA